MKKSKSTLPKGVVLVAFLALFWTGMDCIAQSNLESSIKREIAAMSLEEKVGQLFFITVDSRYHHDASRTFQEWSKWIKKYHAGGLSVYGGNMYAAAQNIGRLQRISERPLLVASTLEWGLPMRLESGTRFPENMAIGATRNPDYAYRQGKIVAREMRATGFHINFAPVVDVNNNPDNPIINVRSYGEDPGMVSRLAVRFIEGLQEGGLAATAKHYPGHGDTNADSHLLLPYILADRARLDSLELVPFAVAVKASVKVVMTAHIALPGLPSGEKPATFSAYLLNDILRDSLGFKGLIVTDALNMGGVVNGYWPGEAAVKAIQAGSDMILLPPDFELAWKTVLKAVKEDRIPEKRIDESLRRILKLKQELNIEENRYPDMQQISRVLEDPSSELLAEKIFRESLTLVKDENYTLPLDAGKIDSATAVILTDEIRSGFPGDVFLDEIGKRIDRLRVFQIGPDPSDELLTEAEQAIRTTDAAILGAFVQFRDFKGSIGLPGKQADWLNRMLQQNPSLVTVGFGNPYLLRYFPQAPAYMATYSVAGASQRAAVEAVFGEIPISGKLPITLPSGYPFGHGLIRNRSSNIWAEKPDPARFRPVVQMIEEAISDSVAPGMAVYIAREGTVRVARGFGNFTYQKDSPKVTRNTIYDLASLTKVVAATPVAMHMYEQNLLHLNKPVSSYIPEFKGGLKDSVTVRNLLTHSGGLGWIPFWRELDDPAGLVDRIAREPLAYKPADSTVYTDLGPMLIQKIVEKLGGKPFDDLAYEELYQPMGMEHTRFNPPASWKNRIAPTEYDRVYRHRQIRGEVHDENAAFLGGVSGHAGLFSTIGDLGRYGQLLLSNGYLNGTKYFNSTIIDLFTTRQNLPPGSSRALGWDTPEADDPVFGSYFSSQAFCHTGFTGTSIAIDPKYDIVIILLTNRVYPTRENHRLRQFRPAFHNTVMEMLLSREERSARRADGISSE